MYYENREISSVHLAKGGGRQTETMEVELHNELCCFPPWKFLGLTFWNIRCQHYYEVSEVFVTGKATKTFSFVVFFVQRKVALIL